MSMAAAMRSGGDPGPVVRPYAWTRGRTRPNVELAIETLLSTTTHGTQEERNLLPEKAAVVRCCQRARSLAEVAATLGVPLGVARVLVSDMADEKLLAVHEPAGDSDDRTHHALLERVLRGLRKL